MPAIVEGRCTRAWTRDRNAIDPQLLSVKPEFHHVAARRTLFRSRHPRRSTGRPVRRRIRKVIDVPRRADRPLCQAERGDLRVCHAVQSTPSTSRIVSSRCSSSTSPPTAPPARTGGSSPGRLTTHRTRTSSATGGPNTARRRALRHQAPRPTALLRLRPHLPPGGDVVTVQRSLGHAKATTLNTYAHLWPARGRLRSRSCPRRSVGPLDIGTAVGHHRQQSRR